MPPPVGKNLLLAVLSTAIAAALFSTAYEAYASAKYDRWHSAYREIGDWYNHLTVASPDPVLLWEYRPNGEYKAGRLKTNKYGFRQPDNVSLKKSDSGLRIAFIGDSVTLGFKVKRKESFVYQFEKISRNLFPRLNVEALNFGVDGYNTIQIERLLKTKVIQFLPDEVVYVLCLNDFDFEESSGNKILYFKKPKIFLEKNIDHLYIRIAYNGEDYHEYFFNKNQREVFHSIYKMAEETKKRGIKFSVFILPIFSPASKIEFFHGRKSYIIKSFDDYPLFNIHTEIKNSLIKLGINVIDLLEAFREEGKSPRSYAYDVWHPNPNGHRVIARAMVRALLRPKAPPVLKSRHQFSH